MVTPSGASEGLAPSGLASIRRLALRSIALTLALTQTSHAAYALVVLQSQPVACAGASAMPDTRVEVGAVLRADRFAPFGSDLREVLRPILVAHREAAMPCALRSRARTSPSWLRWPGCVLRGAGRGRCLRRVWSTIVGSLRTFRHTNVSPCWHASVVVNPSLAVTVAVR